MPTTKTFTASNSLDIDGSPIITGGLAIGTSTEVATGLKVATGNVDVDLGNITVTTGNATITAGDLTVTAGIATAKALKSSGLHADSNANGQARLVGSTANGAPTGSSYAYVAGDLVVGRDGKLWVCTSSGSPGTWTEIAAGGGGGGTTSQDLTIGAGLSPYTETFNGSVAKTISLDLSSQNTWTAVQTFPAAGIKLSGTSGTTTLQASSSASGTITLPSATGIVALSSDTTYIGATSIALNRSSAEQILTGITGFSTLSKTNISTSDITIETGNADGYVPGGSSGNIYIRTGVPSNTSGGKTAGSITIDTGYTAVHGKGNILIGLTNAGSVQLPSGKTKIGNSTLTQGGSYTYTLPSVNANTTLVSLGDTGTVSNTMLENSSLSVNGKSIELGGSATLVTDDVAEAALSPTNLYFTTARARDAFSQGTGVTITNGAIAIGQAVSTTSDVTFNNVTVGGNLTVSGTTTQINSTVTTIVDPVIDIGGGTNGAAPSTDDSKDRGIVFQWHNGASAKKGFFGFQRNTQRFSFVPDATITGEVVSGTKGNIDVNNVFASTGLVIDSLNGISSLGSAGDHKAYLGFMSPGNNNWTTTDLVYTYENGSTRTVPYLSRTSTWSASQTFSADSSFTSGTSSTSKTTGALTVTGGIGASGDIWASNVNGSTFTINKTTSGKIILQAEDASGNQTFTLPASYGTSNQVLSTNGSGTLSWYSVQPLDEDLTAIAGITETSGFLKKTAANTWSLDTSAYTVSGSILNADVSATAAIAYSKLALTGSIVNADIAANAAIAVSKLASSSLTVNGQSISLGGTGTITANTSQALTIGNNLSGTLTTGGTSASTFNGGSGVTIALSSTLTGLTSLALTSGSVATTIQGSSSTTANYTLTLPTSAGINGYVLMTNGSGILSWTPHGATLTIGTGLSGTSYNGGSAVTIAVDSTVALRADTHYIGTTSVALNRASANLALTGITSVAMPSGSSTTTIQGSSSATASYTLTLPVSAGTNGQVLTTNGSGVLSWSTISGGGSTPLYAKTYNFVGTISTGTGTIRWYPDATITITGVDAAVSTVPSGGSCVFVVKLNGATTITTYTITSGNNTSTTTSVNQVMGITDYLTVDVTSANSAADGYVAITYTR